MLKPGVKLKRICPPDDESIDLDERTILIRDEINCTVIPQICGGFTGRTMDGRRERENSRTRAGRLISATSAWPLPSSVSPRDHLTNDLLSYSASPPGPTLNPDARQYMYTSVTPLVLIVHLPTTCYTLTTSDTSILGTRVLK